LNTAFAQLSNDIAADSSDSLLSNSLYEEESDSSLLAADGVVIRNLVQEQIIIAKEKEQKSLIFNPEIISEAAAENIAINNNEFSLIAYFENIPSNFILFFFGAVGIIILTVIKRSTKTDNNSHKKLVKNISAIRTETPIVVKNSRLISLRKKLVKQKNLQLNNGNFSSVARELKISKGELILAARLQSKQAINISGGFK
jgi:hypothetical protein